MRCSFWLRLKRNIKNTILANTDLYVAGQQEVRKLYQSLSLASLTYQLPEQLNLQLHPVKIYWFVIFFSSLV